MLRSDQTMSLCFFMDQFFSLSSINGAAFKTETQVVYCAVRNKSLALIHVRLSR